ncbi:2-amino-4-hydroxy-6-hydroxymethyldihydropteridine diphosphokinase [Frigoribacterium sp. NBH87]|uniref:2-amino-4-hydroxy-6- hydroxymethyldihydropteridine diphosphokinase n=1 Tax=Frigoribacterium sp. NBH87 TaxID=2596916 RepID=UPI001628DFAA|nr:2-amino-4-hydroxy-6-hydroxymethyldihydropteridine diphosphokinase [Frigoribacterium sp. NBH87]
MSTAGPARSGPGSVPVPGSPTAPPGPLARRAVIALGSNLGDRDGLLRDAVAALDAVDGVHVVAASAPVSSVAVTLDGPDESKPDYLNAVALVDTTLGGLDLLAALQSIESDRGRVRTERWGDRTLDLDVVVLGDDESDDPRLTLPHPRAAGRAFVLEPWLQVEPEARLGRAGRVADLLAALPDRTRPVAGAGALWPPAERAPGAVRSEPAAPAPDHTPGADA